MLVDPPQEVREPPVVYLVPEERPWVDDRSGFRSQEDGRPWGGWLADEETIQLVEDRGKSGSRLGEGRGEMEFTVKRGALRWQWTAW